MDTNAILNEIQDKLPRWKMRKVSLAEIKNRLDSLSDDGRTDAFLKIQESKLKIPIIVDVCNFFVGSLGVARFMIGDWVLGLIRLVFFLLYLAIVSVNDGSEEMNLIQNIFTIVGIWGWWLVDLILVEKKVRMQNLRKVLLAIDSVKNQSK